MLSSVGDTAVGAVGTANTYISVFIMNNIGMTLTIRFLNQMDAEGVNVTARSYAVQIANFSYCIGAALAQANAIMTGWRIGAKQYDECDRQTKKAVGMHFLPRLLELYSCSFVWLEERGSLEFIWV